VVEEYGGRARFVSENYGQSGLAKRYGLTRYPALFVNDVLVATPNDFGFYGAGEDGAGGRYAPFVRNAANQEKLQADLRRMVDLLLAGRAGEARAVARPSAEHAIARMPAFTLTDLDGHPVSRDSLLGRPVLVEFWATWCPPCRGTLQWLGTLRQRHGDRVAVLAIAVESADDAVRKVAGDSGLPIRFAMGQPQVVRAFGDLGAVPTLFLFGPDGRTEAVFYGATPTLHADAESAVARLLPGGSR
jgi:thiol-disulfide isomerase/thioredoxin